MRLQREPDGLKAIKLVEFNYELIHPAGEQLAYVDAMSRAPTGKAIESLNVLLVYWTRDDWLTTMQIQDVKLKRIVAALNGTTTPEDINQLQFDYMLDGGRLFRKTKDGPQCVVPVGVRWRMLKATPRRP